MRERNNTMKYECLECGSEDIITGILCEDCGSGDIKTISDLDEIIELMDDGNWADAQDKFCKLNITEQEFNYFLGTFMSEPMCSELTDLRNFSLLVFMSRDIT